MVSSDWQSQIFERKKNGSPNLGDSLLQWLTSSNLQFQIIVGVGGGLNGMGGQTDNLNINKQVGGSK